MAELLEWLRENLMAVLKWGILGLGVLLLVPRIYLGKGKRLPPESARRKPEDEGSQTGMAPVLKSRPEERSVKAKASDAWETLQKSVGKLVSAGKGTNHPRGAIAYEPEKVEFAVFSPKRISPGSSFILDVWAYLRDQYPDIMEIAKSLGRDTVLARKPGVSVEKGAILTVRVEIGALEIPDSIVPIVWDGSPVNASFIVHVPGETRIGSFPGKVYIGCQGMTVAQIVFLINIAPESYFGYTNRSRTVYPQTAFASYASQDRDEVLARVQGMKKVAPDLEVFIDLFSLRSGQNWRKKLEQHVPSKDVFYLFWSQHASLSEWVEREWKLALERRGIDYIDPVPLEEPEFVPPPRELASLHFNDAFLAYIVYERLKKQGAGSA